MKNHKLKILLPIVAIFILSASFVFAQRDLEVPLPGFTPTATSLLPDYIKYVFNFAIGISGLIAFLVLLYGGFRYMTSTGNASIMSDAKDQIFSAGLGILVLLGSWLLLTTINPQLVMINPQLSGSGLVVGDLSGVYLCKTPSECQYAQRSIGDLDSAFEDKVTSVRFVNDPTLGTVYGAVLHERRYYGGTCREFFSDQAVTLPEGGVSSVTVFPIRTSGSDCSGVTIYDNTEYRGKSINVLVPGQASLGDFDEKARSIKVNGTCEVLLFRNTDYGDACEVMSTKEDPNLNNNFVTCTPGFPPDFSCLTKINTVSSLKIISK